MEKDMWWKWGWRVGPVALVVVTGLVRGLLVTGWGNLKAVGRIALGNGLLVGGWVVGWVLPDLLLRPEVVKLLPLEMAKSMRGAIFNVVTALALATVGIWVVSSSGSPVASGLIFGLGVRLFSEVLSESEIKKWYWVLARQVSETEHKMVETVWGGVLLLQFWMLLRG